jgi:hypothetical protein
MNLAAEPELSLAAEMPAAVLDGGSGAMSKSQASRSAHSGYTRVRKRR